MLFQVDFGRMNLYEISKGTKNKLRRSHFEGVYARVTLSEHLTSINLRVSYVQVCLDCFHSPVMTTQPSI